MSIPVVYKTIVLLGLLAAVFDTAHAQNVNYVGSTILFKSVGGTAEYRYTKKVHLRDGFRANSSEGRFAIKSMAVNPPPSPDKNYMRIESPKVATTSENELTNFGRDAKSVSYTYSDGVGRTSFTSSAESGPTYQDIAQHYEYDPLTGRSEEKYLPFVKHNNQPGIFVANGKGETMSFYASAPNGVASDSKPFARSEYDARSRMKSATGPGEAWHENDKKTSYEYELYDPIEHDEIAHWIVSGGNARYNRYYTADELSIVIIEDPEGRQSRTVTDWRGLTITAQVYDETLNKWTGSHNVFDDFGRLRFIIPPLLADLANEVSNISGLDAKVDKLAFQYEYDGRGRQTREKAPSSGWMEYVYDDRDRMVFSRHEEQRLNGGPSWTFYKYDALNRSIVSGQFRTNNSRSSLQNLVNHFTTSYETFEGTGDFNTGYSLDGTYPFLDATNTSSFEILTVNYFDDYAFLANSNWDEEGHNFTFQSPSGFNGIKATNTVDLPTGNKTKVLGSSTWLNSVIYYDERHRAIQTVAENHLGGLDRVTNELDWEGELQQVYHEHTGNEPINILYEYEYDHAGRILKDYHTIEGQARVLTTEYNYNALGELIEKNLHSENGSSFLQSIDYRYNIRGWLSSINNPQLSATDDGGDIFGMCIKYTTASTINGVRTKERYDGLMSSIEWKADNRVDDRFKRSITGYDYDDRNQLVGTNYATYTGAIWSGNAHNYDFGSSYDNNGNIESLTRNASNGVIDDLDYTYASDDDNQLVGVRDDSGDPAGLDDYYPGTDYEYNGMGNMTSDLNKKITGIVYNHLQLVSHIFFDNDQTQVQYTYDAAGIKLSKRVVDEYNNEISRVDYLGDIEYLDGTINQLFTSEGRAYKQAGKFHYEYFITDHQQNNRAAFGNLPDRNIYTLTAENERDAYEESHFEFEPAQRIAKNNHTPLGNESIYLNGVVANRRIGPAKVLDISTNDEVSLEVWARYGQEHWDTGSVAGFLSTFLSTLPSSGTGLTSENATSGLSSSVGNPGALGLFGNATNRQPSAYLQYIFFDEEFNFVPEHSGFQEVTDDSYKSYAKLSSGKLTFDRSGHLLVYLANESNENADVYFDDLKIMHESSNANFKVSQINEYYPFGLPTDNSWRAEGYTDPGLLYQSAYATMDSLTGYYDFLSRSYDPVLGRFFAVDPAGQFASPYVGMGNAPHLGIDPDGEVFHGLASIAAGAIQSLFGSAVKSAGFATANALNGGSFSDSFVGRGFSSDLNLAGPNLGHINPWVGLREAYGLSLSQKPIGTGFIYQWFPRRFIKRWNEARFQIIHPDFQNPDRVIGGRVLDDNRVNSLVVPEGGILDLGDPVYFKRLSRSAPAEVNLNGNPDNVREGLMKWLTFLYDPISLPKPNDGRSHNHFHVNDVVGSLGKGFGKGDFTGIFHKRLASSDGSEFSWAITTGGQSLNFNNPLNYIYNVEHKWTDTALKIFLVGPDNNKGGQNDGLTIIFYGNRNQTEQIGKRIYGKHWPH